MKVLFILEYFHPHIGGVETLFKHLTESLVQKGVDVVVVTNKYHSKLPFHEDINGVRIYRYPFKNRYIFTFLGWIPALKWARSADIIHSTSYNAAFPAWLAAKLLRKKKLITFHEFWGKTWFELPFLSRFSAYLHHIMERLIIYFAFDHYVAVSDFTMAALREAGVPADRISRIYNGIPARTELSPKPDRPAGSTFRFLYFGRLSYSKGLDVLIRAAGQLKQWDESFAVEVVTSPGPTWMLRAVKRMADEESLGDCISWYFELPGDELRKKIQSSDAVVIPSYSEGFCFAAVETIDLGTPVVSSGRGALKEVVSGKYVEAEKLTPVELARAMQKAINGDWSVRMPINFPLETTIEEYMQLYSVIR